MSDTETTDILSHPQGPLRNARVFPEIVNGWTRNEVWFNTDAGNLCGDYAAGPGIENYYKKVMPDGTVLGVEVVTFFELRPDDVYADDGIPPDAELFASQRYFFHSAANAEDFENQHFIVEDYEYEPIDCFIRNLEDGEMKAEDVEWLITQWGDTDEREYLSWQGEPIHG